MLDRCPQRLLEVNWVLNMEAVHRVAARPVAIPGFGVANKRVIEGLLEHPGIAEVVFQARSLNCGPGLLPINEEHVVAFPPPPRGASKDVENRPYVLAFACSLQERVVVLTIDVSLPASASEEQPE